MARDIPDWYLDALAKSHGVRTRVVLLDDDRQPMLEITGDDGFVFDGSFTATRGANPSRTAGLSIANPGGTWTPRTIASEFKIGRYATLERGIVSASGTVLFQLMLAQITDPIIQVSVGDDWMGIKLVDLWRTMQKGRYQSVFVKQRGMRVQEFIRSVAPLAGWLDDDTAFDLDDGGATFAEDQPIDLYSLVTDDMQSTTEDFALWLRVGYDGTMVLTPAPTVDNQGDPIRSYSPGETTTLMGLTKQLTDAGFYNHTRVTGQSVRSGTVVAAEWRDLNPLSPSYNPVPGTDIAWPRGGGPMGDRMMEPYESAMVLTEAQAFTKAQELGFNAATLQEQHNLTAIGDASVEPGDVYHSEVDEADASGDLLINDMSFSLTEGEDDLFTVTAARQRQLTAGANALQTEDET